MEKSIYELTLITDQKTAEKVVKELIEGILAKVNGRLVDFNFWGKKDLIYPIKKQATVNFSFCEIELEKAKVFDLKNRLGMNDDIWRHLIVTTGEVKKTKKIIKKKTK